MQQEQRSPDSLDLTVQYNYPFVLLLNYMTEVRSFRIRPALEKRAMEKAERIGISFSEYLRGLIVRDLEGENEAKQS